MDAMNLADMDLHAVLIPAGAAIDGAVVELQQHPDGVITGEIRIPAHQPQEIPLS